MSSPFDPGDDFLLYEFTDVAVGPDGKPVGAGGGSRGVIEPVETHAVYDGPAVYPDPPSLPQYFFLAILRSDSLTERETAFVQAWLVGGDDETMAKQLKWTADDVRSARQSLEKRIHLTIDPPST